MRKNINSDYIKKLSVILNSKIKDTRGNLDKLVINLYKKKDKLLKLINKYPTPFYVFDRNELIASINEFNLNFKKNIPNFKPFYAIKLNSYNKILKTVLDNGFGLDVSSGRELEIAIKNGANDILFSGPGKTYEDLESAVKNNKITRINVDSFGELNKLDNLTRKLKIKIKIGVRIFTENNYWNKFGIHLNNLKTFWIKAMKSPFLEIQGIQFHSSWNGDSHPYENNIKKLGNYLKKNFNLFMLKSVKYIDFGGGFRPDYSEGYFPWKTPKGAVIKAINNFFNEETVFSDKYFITNSISIEEYSLGISWAIKKYLSFIKDCNYYSEPGRIICNNAFHIILKVVDIKESGRAILDGGINIVGWERFEYDYFPILNLTNPAMKEINYRLYGCLCMPQDIWGYYCYASKIEEGDIIMVPYQGALTYSLAQNFIKPIPEVIDLV